MIRVCSIFTITTNGHKPKEVLDKMGVCGTKVYKIKPMHCPICKSVELDELEVVGISDEPIFWECDSCGSLHCKEDRNWIENQIRKFEGCWTNPSDWETPSKEDFI
jgi:copper chaperone CopZ